jgi:PAS domain S-box-containing protein
MSNKEISQFDHYTLASIPGAVVTVDDDFKITSFNRRAETITGYSSSEAIGRQCYEILNNNRCENDCPVQTIRNNVEPLSSLEAEIVTRHGEHISIRMSAASILSEQEKRIRRLLFTSRTMAGVLIQMKFLTFLMLFTGQHQ